MSHQPCKEKYEPLSFGAKLGLIWAAIAMIALCILGVWGWREQWASWLGGLDKGELLWLAIISFALNVLVVVTVVQIIVWAYRRDKGVR
jgi:uncharacterized membrane protein